MCYNARYLTLKKQKYADRLGQDYTETEKLINQLDTLTEQVGPVYHTTAFDHRDLPVITNKQPDEFQLFHWGLIPHFVKDTTQYEAKYSTRYLNSRVETLFEEKLYNEKLGKELDNPFFKSALERRCLVMLDGYYDWHWKGKNSYNFHILLKSEDPVFVAGIWRSWESKSEGISKNTVSMITTDANPLCRKIHNKPKASEGPRQLALLDRESAQAWLEEDANVERLKKIIRVFPESQMKAYPVKKLFVQDGRTRIPLNDEECIKEVRYPELKLGREDQDVVQGSLF